MILILQKSNLYSILLLFTYQFSVLQAESQNKSDFPCQSSHFATLDYNFDVFCPKLIIIFKNDSDSTMKKSISKTSLKNAGYLSEDDKPKVNANTSICQFIDSGPKLLSSVISNIPWNFTQAEQSCRQYTLKFSDYDKLPCEMKGEVNHSRPLSITTNGIRAFFSETNQICVTEPQFLLLIFKIQKGLVCSLKVQQHKIDPDIMEKECKDIEASSSCGLYPCSREKDVEDQLIQVTGPMTLSTSDQSPRVNYLSSTIGGNNHDKPKKKVSIEDYLFELSLLALLVTLLLICFLTNCCGLNKATNNTHYIQNVYGKRCRHPPTQIESGLHFGSIGLPLASLKFANKPAGVYSSDKMGNSSGNNEPLQGWM